MLGKIICFILQSMFWWYLSSLSEIKTFKIIFSSESTFISYVTQYNKRYILSTLTTLRFLHFLTDDLISFPMIPNSYILKWHFWKYKFYNLLNFLLFSLYFTHCFAHYLRINLADKMSLLLYWVTYTVHRV